MRILDAVDHALTRSATFVGGVLSIATVLIVAYSVFMRYLANIPQTWTDELVGYFLVAIVMFVATKFFMVGVLIAVWAGILMFVMPVAKNLSFQEQVLRFQVYL